MSIESSLFDYERILCQLPQSHVFKIPVRKTAEGHRAADWPQVPTWTGKLRIVSKGSLAIIQLIDDKNGIFAQCPVSDDSVVERTLDSGRYFVLKIANDKGQHAFIGIAFNERNDAFDFNIALSEFKAECERETQAQKSSFLDDVSKPLMDLTIKEGEKMKITINKPPRTGSVTQKAKVPLLNGGRLLPPPGESSIPVFSSPSSSTKSSTNSSADLMFGATATSSVGFSSPASDPFGSTSDPFGSTSDPFGSTSDPFGSTSDPFGSTSDPFASNVFKEPTASCSSSGGKFDAFGFPI